MSLQTLYLFLPACFAINMSPGPNNLLAMSHASRYGFAAAVAGGVGRLVAFAMMITLASLGLAVVLQASAWLFFLIKMAGGLYLLWLAWRLWQSPISELSLHDDRPIRWTVLARREWLVAAGNPKAILFFTAFLPQFVDPGRPVAPQFFLLAVLLILLELVALGTYALIGAKAARWFSRPSHRRLFNRGSALALGLAGTGLLMSTRNS